MIKVQLENGSSEAYHFDSYGKRGSAEILLTKATRYSTDIMGYDYPTIFLCFRFRFAFIPTAQKHTITWKQDHGVTSSTRCPRRETKSEQPAPVIRLLVCSLVMLWRLKFSIEYESPIAVTIVIQVIVTQVKSKFPGRALLLLVLRFCL